MALFAFTVFSSAFLLFLIQPLMGKIILPWFGGAPSVWNTCMVYFQSLLVAGYAYAHFLAGRLTPARQSRLHLGVLGFAVGALVIVGASWGTPIIPDASLRPVDSGAPIARIVLILTLSVGLPYLALSATGPLLQAWFARVNPGGAAYRLYALSNLGSLLALFAYPLALERLLAVRIQGWFWATGFVLFAVCCALVARRVGQLEPAADPVAATPATTEVRNDEAAPTVARYVLWALLAACASLSFLASTSRLSQEIAPVPFLWLAPLGLYLLTFVLCFESDRWYRRGPVLGLLMLATFAVGACVLVADDVVLGVQIGSFLSGQFLLCMACHGELARMRPPTRWLTNFYLMVSIGGALGGTFVTFVAPKLFTSYAELPLAYLAGWLLVGAAVVLDRKSDLYSPRRWLAGPGLAVAVAGGVLWSAWFWRLDDSGYVYEVRNFYGVNRVERTFDPEDPVRGVQWTKLLHGRINHGLQYRGAEREPTAYHWKESGVGLAMKKARELAASEGRGLRIGIVGLGVGVLAAYGEEGDVIRVYEIDPDVIRLALGNLGYFSFLKDTPAEVEVVEGDARTSLERELREGGSNHFDVLVLDAYSGDAMPIHLLTVEALNLYLTHLRDERSLLVVQTTNVHLDVRAVVERLAEELGLAQLSIDAEGDPRTDYINSWDLLSRRPESLVIPALAGYQAGPRRSPPVGLWTDDHHSLFEILGPRDHRPWNPRGPSAAPAEPRLEAAGIP